MFGILLVGHNLEISLSAYVCAYVYRFAWKGYKSSAMQWFVASTTKPYDWKAETYKHS